MSLATKYRPSTWEEVSEQSVVIDILKSLCESDDLENRNFLLIGPAGTGKAQPLTSKVLTPSGFIDMGDVQIGTEVFTHSGDVATVSGVFPQGFRPVYQINLVDGSNIRVADNHLNYIWEKTDCEEAPYITHPNVVTTELIEMVRAGDIEYGVPSVYVSSCEQEDIQIRKDYIQRIMNTHSVHPASNTYFFDKDEAHLSAMFSSALRSLGYVDNVSESKTSIFHTVDNDSEFRKIASIEYVGDEECQCILVDHPDHTYISDNFIPTHNTTTGRIMANVLNKGLGEPIELDAASHGGVDSVRQLVEQAKLYPVGCKYKVFILDECHAFSSAAWQALLKPLEEGPARSVFCLCTTNPEKIPATVLSRVQKFQLSKISLQGIIDRLTHILECEKAEGKDISYDAEAVSYIAKLANGGMRDAITLLEKALSYSTAVSSETIEVALGLPNYDDYFELLQAYAKRDNAAIAGIVDRVYNSGVNFVTWFEQFHSFVINVVKYILLQDINQTMIPAHYQPKISKYGVNHTVICLKLANKLIKMNSELKTTQYLQELALTYLCSIPKKEG